MLEATKMKVNVDDVVHDLEELLFSEGAKERLSSRGLSAIEKAIKILSNRTVIRIGGSDVIIISDDDIELRQFRKGSQLSKRTKGKELVEVMTIERESEDTTSNEDKYVSTRVVADYFKVTPQTVRDWIDKKLISAHRIGTSGRFQIPREEFEFLKKMHDESMEENEEIMKNALGGDYDENWEIDFNDEGEMTE